MANKFLKTAIILCGICAGFSGCTPEEQEFIDPIPIATSGKNLRTTGFTATWRPLLGAESYLLEIAADAAFEEGALMTETPVEVQDTAYTIEGLEVANTYYYRLLARLSTGEQTRYSDVVTVRTLGMPSPVAIVATDIGPNQFTSHWQKVIEAKTYEIEINRDIDFPESDLVQRIVTEDTFVVVKNNLEVDQDYFYRIIARDGDVVSDVSNVVHLTTTQLTKPIISSAPDTVQNEFTFEWESVVGAEHYTVDVTTDPLFLSTEAYLVEDEITQETAFTVTNLDPGISYYYRVRAHSDKSFSEYSDKGEVASFSLPTPVLQEASNLSATSFTATWTSVSDVDTYTLDVSTYPDFSTILLTVDDITDYTYNIEALTGDQRYYYRVRAEKDGNYSAYSNIMSQYLAALEQPANLIASNITYTSFTVTWEVVADASYYLVDVATDDQFTNILSNYREDSVSKTSLNVEGLTANTRYYLRVKARNDYASSDYSETLSTTTIVVNSPTAQSPTNVDSYEAYTKWTLVPDASSYLLDISTDAAFTTFLLGYEALSVAGTSLMADRLLPSTTYYYRVRAVVDGNISEYSNTVSMTTDAVPVQSVSSIIEAEYFTQNDGTTPVADATASGEYYLGSIEKDDSVAYQVDIPSSGTYTVTFRVANSSGGSKIILFKQGGNVSLVDVPLNGADWGWDVESVLVNFTSSGEQTIWLEFEGGSGSGEIMRLDWLEIE